MVGVNVGINKTTAINGGFALLGQLWYVDVLSCFRTILQIRKYAAL
jgi:hypothetical protein